MNIIVTCFTQIGILKTIMWYHFDFFLEPMLTNSQFCFSDAQKWKYKERIPKEPGQCFRIELSDWKIWPYL